MGTAITIIGYITALVFILITVPKTIPKVYGFFQRQVLNKDIACRVIEHETGDTCNTKIRLAYSGTSKNILGDIQFVYELRLPLRFLNRLLSHINIVVGYITCDMQGLKTILGTEFNPDFLNVHSWNKRKLIKYPISVLYGLMLSYIILLMFIVFPIGWPVIMAGPYRRFSLNSKSEGMSIYDESNNIIQLPKILSEGDILNLNVTYKMGLNAKGFKVDAPFRYIDEFPPITIRPPKPGMFAWFGKGSVRIIIGGRFGLKTNYKDKVIIGIGSN